MSETIGFRQPTECLGRNGVMTMTGLHISRQADHLFIAPVTSQMRIGRAWMLIPVEAVPDIAQAMLRLSGKAQTAQKAAA